MCFEKKKIRKEKSRNKEIKKTKMKETHIWVYESLIMNLANTSRGKPGLCQHA